MTEGDVEQRGGSRDVRNQKVLNQRHASNARKTDRHSKRIAGHTGVNSLNTNRVDAVGTSSSLMKGGAVENKTSKYNSSASLSLAAASASSSSSSSMNADNKQSLQRKSRQSAVDLARQQAEHRRQQHAKINTPTMTSSPPTSPGNSQYPRGRRGGNRRELQVQQARAAAAAKAAKKATTNNDAYAAGKLAAARAKARNTSVGGGGQPPAARNNVRAGGRGPPQRSRGLPRPPAPLLMGTQPPLLTPADESDDYKSKAKRRKRPRGKKNRTKN